MATPLLRPSSWLDRDEEGLPLSVNGLSSPSDASILAELDVSGKGAEPDGAEICEGPFEKTGAAVVVCEEEDEKGDADAGNGRDEEVVCYAPAG